MKNLPPTTEVVAMRVKADLSVLVSHHPREFEGFRYVYPVYSRRAGGISVGVNLNPDKACSFRCVYCQVDRATPAPSSAVVIPQMMTELREIIREVLEENLFRCPPFSLLPYPLRRLRDIAFSGDGEPTLCPLFFEAVRTVVQVKTEMGLEEVKAVLFTNASCLDDLEVQEALALLDQHEGEVWAKLDAGTQRYFRLVCRTSFPLERVLQNILLTARRRPVVIQSLFQRIHGEPPPREEIRAYCERLSDLRRQGGQLRLVQVYTIARPPAEPFVTPLSEVELKAIAQQIEATAGVPAKAF